MCNLADNFWCVTWVFKCISWKKRHCLVSGLPLPSVVTTVRCYGVPQLFPEESATHQEKSTQQWYESQQCTCVKNSTACSEQPGSQAQAAPSMSPVDKLAVWELLWEGLQHAMAHAAPGSSLPFPDVVCLLPALQRGAGLWSLYYGCTKSLLIFRRGKCAYFLLSMTGKPRLGLIPFIHVKSKSKWFQREPDHTANCYCRPVLLFRDVLQECLGMEIPDNISLSHFFFFYNSKKYSRSSPSPPVHCRWNSFGPWSECNGCTQKQV